jgi:hypothetical protein
VENPKIQVICEVALYKTTDLSENLRFEIEIESHRNCSMLLCSASSCSLESRRPLFLLIEINFQEQHNGWRSGADNVNQDNVQGRGIDLGLTRSEFICGG